MEYEVGYKIGNIEVVNTEYIKERKTHICYCKCLICGKIIKHSRRNMLKLKGNGCKTCVNKQRAKNAVKHTRLYNVWKQMKHRCRCTQTDYNHWKHYSGRGIDICKEWETYEPFRKWAYENGWNEDDLYLTNRNKLTIDRINNDGNYCPQNCRVVSHSMNQLNKRNTIKVKYKNKMYTIPELSNILNINSDILRHRIKNGWEEKSWGIPKRCRRTKNV